MINSFFDMKRVSIYLQAGKFRAVTYYRFAQYFDAMKINVVYNLMIPDAKAYLYLPIAKQSIIMKIFIFFYIFARVQWQLLVDIYNPPSYIIISRRLLPKILPWSFYACLSICKHKGCKIIWDFDDQIMYLKEVTNRGFSKMEKVSDIIIVGSPILKNIIDIKWRYKVHVIPTTDGDMYKTYSNDILEKRLLSFEYEIKLIWVGTFSGLRYLQSIMPSLERFGLELKKVGKKVRLSIVCDYPLSYCSTNFILENIKWERNVAKEKMFESHIGLMPLDDNDGTRGKCSFKLIQYMSVGLPVIGSSVGMNSIVIKDSFGYLPCGTDIDQWYNALVGIVADKKGWIHRSQEAIKVWAQDYSYLSNLERWKQILLL